MPRRKEPVRLTDDERELAEEHAGLAHWFGFKVRFGYEDPATDEDDAKQDAALGLLAAAQSFDEDRGAFANYAVFRMRGSVADGRRKVDPVSRRVRGIQRRRQEAIAALRQELGRNPTFAEVRDRLGITPREEAELQALMRPVSFNADRAFDDGNAALPLSDLLEDARSEAELHEGELREALEPLIAGLPERLQFVVRCRYFADMSQDEVGEVLGVSGSRVSQLETKALKALRPLVEDAELSLEAA